MSRSLLWWSVWLAVWIIGTKVYGARRPDFRPEWAEPTKIHHFCVLTQTSCGRNVRRGEHFPIPTPHRSEAPPCSLRLSRARHPTRRVWRSLSTGGCKSLRLMRPAGLGARGGLPGGGGLLLGGVFGPKGE